MKILPFSPKNEASKQAIDNSRFGFTVEPVVLTDLKNKKHGVVIFGISDDTGIKNVGGRPGAAEGPEVVRQKLYKFTTGSTRIPVYDLGNLQPAAAIEETHTQAAAVITEIHRFGHTPIIIGGGHDLGFPPALALLQTGTGKKAVILNIDAHLDVRPVAGKITSGSPWYLLAEHDLFRSSKSKVVEFGLQRHCNAHSLVSYAESRKFELHWLEEIRQAKGSPKFQFERLLKKHGTKADLLVSLDIDCVQWADAPGCSAPQTVGFTAAESIQLSHASGKSGKVKSFGIFELSPPLDPDGRTATLAAHCIIAFLQGRGAWQ